MPEPLRGSLKIVFVVKADRGANDEGERGLEHTATG